MRRDGQQENGEAEQQADEKTAGGPKVARGAGTSQRLAAWRHDLQVMHERVDFRRQTGNRAVELGLGLQRRVARGLGGGTGGLCRRGGVLYRRDQQRRRVGFLRDGAHRCSVKGMGSFLL